MQMPNVTESRRLSAHTTQRELVHASLRRLPKAGVRPVPERDLVARARLAPR